MTRILVTGGSGFIATHLLDILLKEGHSVVTTVRNQQKADAITSVFSSYGKDQLDFTIVEDIAKAGAFDKAVVSSPPFETVIHTASPFQLNAKNIQIDLIDPAVNGTTSILKAIKASAPSVKRVVITSSFASVIDTSKDNWPGHVYSEKEWNPMTLETALSHPARGYTGSKTFAEKAAWEFVEKEKPSFTLATILPTLVFGPIIPGIHSLSSLNTSNQVIFGITQGMAKDKIPDLGGYAWVDVRDVAAAHYKAATLPEAGGNRYLACGAPYNNKMIVDIIRNNFLEYSAVLPDDNVEGGTFPVEGVFTVDASKAERELGIHFTKLETAIVDTVKSFKAVKKN